MGRKMKEVDITKPKIEGQDNTPEVSKTLPYVSESVLKSRKRRDAERVAKLQGLRKARLEQLTKKKKHFIRAERFVKDFRDKEKDRKRLLNLEKRLRDNTLKKLPVEERLGLVIRIKGDKGVSPKVIKMLNILKLKRAKTAVLLKFNQATQLILKLCEPYITWGYPSLNTVRDLVYKKGFTAVNKKRTPLTSNSMIEKELGKYDIICMEDLVHEIFTTGPNFVHAVNYLYPFKLNTPAGGWRIKKIHFQHGGEFGFRGEKINEMLRKMI